MAKYVLTLLLCLSSPLAWAETIFKIAGQEGDHRFFPILNAIYAQMGMTVDYKILPSSRALASVDTGAYQAEVGRIQEISAAYPNLRYSREPLLSVDLIALVKKDAKITLSTPAELKKLRVGYVIGMSVAEHYVNTTPLNVFPVATHDQLANMLESERIDAALMGTAFRSSPVFKTGVQSLNIATFNVYHIFNKQYGYLIPKFDQILMQMKRDGDYHKLLPAALK